MGVVAKKPAKRVRQAQFDGASEQTPSKKPRKHKPEGPYTRYKEAGAIPELKQKRAPRLGEGTGVKVICWNVGGLRGLLKNRPRIIPELVNQERPDVLAFLEHKLQPDGKDTETVLTELQRAMPKYDIGKLHCSTVKKGYSGVLVLVRKGLTRVVGLNAEDLPAAKKEGRIVVVEFESMYLVFCYVPNSGDGLQRLNDRIKKWDVQLRQRLSTLSKRKPAILVGDLNVAHLDEDIWNVEAPHVAKSAGTTPQERESFGTLLNAGYVDAFRTFYPDALGAFTYWSVRAGNRRPNRGLRLDYVLVPEGMAAEKQKKTGKGLRLVDAFHRADLALGDHCPVGAVIAW